MVAVDDVGIIPSRFLHDIGDMHILPMKVGGDLNESLFPVDEPGDTDADLGKQASMEMLQRLPQSRNQKGNGFRSGRGCGFRSDMLDVPAHDRAKKVRNDDNPGVFLKDGSTCVPLLPVKGEGYPRPSIGMVFPLVLLNQSQMHQF